MTAAHSAKQGGYFLLVGATAAAVHFAVLALAVESAHVPPLSANLIAFAVAFCVSFVGHYRLTFRHSGAHWRDSVLRWLAVSLTGFAANQALFALGLAWLGATYYLPLWFAVTLAVTAFSFIAGKYWAFHAKPPPLRSGGGMGRGCENPRSDDTP